MVSQKDIQKLLASMRCSKCASNFEEDSFSVMRNEDGLFVLQIKCKKCNKGFGMALLGLDKEEILDSINVDFEKTEKRSDSPEVIDYDDILDAHEFIQNLEENWKKYMDKKKAQA